MFVHSDGRALSVLCVLSASLLLVSGEEVWESRSGIQELRTALVDLAVEGRTYLGRLAGEQTLLSVQKAFSQVLAVAAGAVSAALNVLFQNVSHILQAAGVQGVPVPRVSPDGLIFVTQWLLLALIGYWLISLVFGLVASALRRALWLLKVAVALLCFGLILSDRSVDTDTTAIRLAGLVCVCVLLGVGTGRGSAAADRTAQLEQQLKILERRLGDMERWSRTEE
ncbi:voltage-gated monoatomic cation channel TMEM109 [Perca flavescens]|uniref:voltage-gated monoatomic cation channel TMEM109 n=1 Tax=Perca flavescens TaxID=8167 RepID=UPI00106EDCB6|nr:uncharacterized protein LOC114570299 [Perca flavescens]